MVAHLLGVDKVSMVVILWRMLLSYHAIMTVKTGKRIFRAALDEELITQVKVAAAKLGVNPNAIADAALRSFLSSENNLEQLKQRKHVG